MSFPDLSSFGLPAAEVVGQLRNSVQCNDAVIVVAPPGAGKSTLLPLSLLENIPQDKKILMLEPRRIAARQVACRMADMLSEDVGQTVGYRVRFENKVSAKTRIEVLTEGILVRMLHDDNELNDVAMVIFDEFHERSLFADTSLALCRDCQQVLRPDLKIVVMSATIDASDLAIKLDAPIIESKGRMFDVQTCYVGDCDVMTIASQVVETVRMAHAKHEGDILAFLPGEAEIRQCAERLENTLGTTRVFPLYGMLPMSQQQEAIRYVEGRRKIVLATSIAETSLTIEGVKIVVDSGYCKAMKYDPNTGLSRLEIERVSLDMADQRRGRAGRLSSGFCYRMWTPGTEMRMKAHRSPEIEQADLSQLVLDLALWGETNPENLLWLTPPPPASVLRAKELLFMLDAIDAQGRITSHGRRLGRIPCHPRLAQMLLAAKTPEDKSLAADVAALLEERDPLPRETGIDINLRIEALRRNRRERRLGRPFDRIERISSIYRHVVEAQEDNGPVDCYATGMLVAAAYPERIASSHVGNNAVFRLSNGCLAMTSHTDQLANESWLAIANMDARDGKGKIFLASPLNPADLQQYIVERDVVMWDPRKGGVVANREMRIGRLTLSSKPLANISREDIDAAIIAAIPKEGLSMLDWNEDVEQLQNRISSLAVWDTNHQWPDVSTETLMNSPESWISPYLGKSMTIADLKKIDVSEAVKSMLDYPLQLALDQLAPLRVDVLSGSSIKLRYMPNGAPPVLAVRLQECFGLAETPTVCNGTQRVMMHLLSPGFKPVQITQDLSSFWNNAYFEVKKELRQRYPKHSWPDNPWEEPAIRGVKRKTK